MPAPRFPAVRAGMVYALAAAGLFGASTPFAKLLVGSVDPILLAGLLYLGSGCGLFAWQWLGTPPARTQSGQPTGQAA
jgi:hypothetical protein